jgi:iron complex outermembrane recepter protein
VAPASESDFALYGGELQSPFSQAQGGFDPSLLGAPVNNQSLEVPSSPETQYKLFAVYNFDNGFGISGGVVLSDSYYADYDNTIKLPVSVVANASIFYRKPTWEVALMVDNVTDEDYFSGADPYFAGAGIITKAPERSYKASYTYKF